MSFVAPSANLLWFVAVVLAALTTGTVVRVKSLRGAAGDLAKSRLDSLRSWWIVATIILLTAMLGSLAASLVFSLVSLMGVVEYSRLAKIQPRDASYRITLGLVVLAYVLLALSLTQAFRSILPLVAVITLSTALVCQERTADFLSVVSRNVWGYLVTTYMLGHVVLMFTLPDNAVRPTNGAGWFLLLIVLTGGNDIMQALVGRRLGRRKLAPIVSPNKTWEGFAGGVLSTIVLATLLGPRLTAMNAWQSAVAGLLVGVVGLFGDLNMSALKRDARVKDSGTWLPGQGGILDRIDSLTFTAPALYLLARAILQ